MTRQRFSLESGRSLHHFYLITDTAGVFLVVGLELLCPAHDPLVQGVPDECFNSHNDGFVHFIAYNPAGENFALALSFQSFYPPLGPLDPQFPLTHDGLDPGNPFADFLQLHRVIQLTGGHLESQFKSSSLESLSFLFSSASVISRSSLAFIDLTYFPAFHKLCFNRQLVRCQAQGLPGYFFRHAVQLKHDPARLDHGHPVFRSLYWNPSGFPQASQ